MLFVAHTCIRLKHLDSQVTEGGPYLLYSSQSFGKYSLNSDGTPVTESYCTTRGSKVTDSSAIYEQQSLMLCMQV